MDAAQNSQKKVKKLGMKKKQPDHGGDIVFTKHGTIQTIPSMIKRLKVITDPVIGLQYIWEYRSPTKSVPPHYQCRLCKVQRLQNEMAAHITGWKHCFKYIKRCHPDKVAEDEEAATKDPAIRKAIRVAAAEVEKAEGRGKLKVIIKEPSEVSGFQSMKSAFPSGGPPQGGAGLLGPFPRGLRPVGPFGGGFPEPPFPGEFPPQGDFMPDFSPGMRGVLGDPPMRRGQSDMGGYPSPGRYGDSIPGPDRLMGGPDRLMGGPDRLMGGPDRLMGGPDSMQRYPNNGSMRMGSDDFGMGPHSEGMGRPYLDDLPMNSSSDRMFGGGPKGPDNSSTLETLLRYLDTFRIENEDDAQIVLKITQKLTDVLMEYRLRSISSVPSMTSASPSSLSSMNYPSRLSSSSSDRFSSSMSGPSRFYK